MRFITAIAVAFTASISFVAAQDKCAAQNIVDNCVAGYQSRIDTCNETPNDFICLCDVYKDVLVCYNNCPDSLEKPPVQNTVTSYCNAAEPLRAAASSSMASVASVAATQSHAQASETSAATSATGTASEDAPAATATTFEGVAGKKGVKAGAAIVALFGAAGFL